MNLFTFPFPRKRLLLCAGLQIAVAGSALAQQKITIMQPVQDGLDDAEEGINSNIGVIDLTSSDLELTNDGSRNQYIGIRFRNLDIPQGATIQRAYIQFANKGDKTPVAGDVAIKAELSANAAVFTASSFNISSRVRTADSVVWPGSTDAAWGTGAGGQANAIHRTPNLTALLQQVVNQATWTSGNAAAFILTGSGVRNTYSYNGGSNYAPRLIVEYTTAAAPTLAAAPSPIIPANSAWLFNDSGLDLSTAWQATSYNDLGWSYGPGKLGYEDNAVTMLDYGTDPGNKHITYYFRKHFQVANVAALSDSMELSLLRDDGAIVYINGTEVIRSNMPTGPVTYQTFSSTIVSGTDENTYQIYRIPKTAFQNGNNVIAVEIHQRDGTSSDLGFDLSMKEYFAPPPPVACNPLPANHLSDFVSVLPSAQTDTLRLPSSHTFQMLLQAGDPYTDSTYGNTKSTFDFTGYVPIQGSSSNGYLSINHEDGSWPAAGVSMLDINFNNATKLWQITNNQPVDFGVVQGTGRNCSGTVTPWGTIVTSEEILPTADMNNDGYQDVGWNVEIDPATRAVRDLDGNGTPDKIWKLGRMSHENVVVDYDQKTVYEGNDENPGFIFKMVADSATKLGSGPLYVLKLNGALGTATTGTWIQVPNSTPAECNNVKTFAASVGATNFVNVEDVEISPLDSMVYFTSKSSSRVYRFRDRKFVGTTADVINFEIFVGNSSSTYSIVHSNGTANENWGGGNDNLTFDQQGNLYVLQDGGRNHIWMVRPCHTQANPQVQLFAVTPAGSEPTGMTLSPDDRFMFVSIQHPSSSNTRTVIDAAGNPENFSRNSTIVIARNSELGIATPLPVSFIAFEAQQKDNSEAFLQWRYATDENAVQFEVERMTLGSSFEVIGKVAGAARAAGQALNFTDKQPFAGKNFYRIAALQANGQKVYTPVRSLDFNDGGRFTLAGIWPNPAKQELKVAVVAPAEGTARVTVQSLSGQLLLQQEFSLQSGNNVLPLTISGLASGSYLLTVHNGAEVLHSRFVKE